MQKDVEVSEITDIKDIDSAELAKNENAKFSFGGATLYGINAVIGSGIFLLPRTIYQDLGPASLVAMVLDAVLVLMLAVCFAEVAGYFNKNGGAFQYSKTAFGDFIGFNFCDDYCVGCNGCRFCETSDPNFSSVRRTEYID